MVNEAKILLGHLHHAENQIDALLSNIREMRWTYEVARLGQEGVYERNPRSGAVQKVSTDQVRVGIHKDEERLKNYITVYCGYTRTDTFDEARKVTHQLAYLISVWDWLYELEMYAQYRGPVLPEKEEGSDMSLEEILKRKEKVEALIEGMVDEIDFPPISELVTL